MYSREFKLLLLVLLWLLLFTFIANNKDCKNHSNDFKSSDVLMTIIIFLGACEEDCWWPDHGDERVV